MWSSEKILLIGIILQILSLERAGGGKILSISFMSSKSHRITYDPILRELARRGHEVTVASPIESKDEKNFKNILTIDNDQVFGKQPNYFESKAAETSSMIPKVYNPYVTFRNALVELCRKSYPLPQVQEILKEKYDLVFFTPFLNECLYGLVHTLNTTTVIYQQIPIFPWVSWSVGSPALPSFVPIFLVESLDQMNFKERFLNFLMVSYNWAVMKFYYYPMVEEIYRGALQDPNIPSIMEIEREASIVLSNSHPSISRPRPLLPDVIEVGGLHVSPAKPLPKELDEFLNGSKDGFIYFSMGTFLKGSMMPESYRKMFLNVFGKLRQCVLWKWETEQMEDLPRNVKLSKWLPQQDVLGHRNIRLFITHGGLGGTTEAIFHGVPLVGIPLLGDQPSNVYKASKMGFALPPLDFAALTEEALLEAINTVLSDSSYQENARRLSALFRDQMEPPLDRAVWWVEYVLRHKGAPHLRSAARDLNFIQYFSIDVLAVLSVFGIVSIIINVVIIKALLRKCMGDKKSKAVKSLKKIQ